ncbi:MAG: LCP family protein [Clostridia bacterium]|nr:LCP family protein [Clostridia bacterium]
MLSSVKNFILTFILAVLIFSAAAYLAVNLVVNNINGTLEGDQEATGDASAPVTDKSGSPDPFVIGEAGESLNILVVGCDYRSGVFADYDPQVLEDRLGILPAEFDYQPVPNDLAPPGVTGKIVGDSAVEPMDGVVIPGDRLAFIGGFYEVGYRKIETDTLILIRFDKERKHISYTVFDPDAYVVVNGCYCRLSNILSDYGMATLEDKIHAMTGLIVDRYAMVTCDNFPEVVDALGGINFYVPCNMKYDDWAGNIHIDLKQGRQQLDGQKALQLLMYNSYTDGFNSRARTTMNFVQSFISDLTLITNYFRMGDIIKAVDGMFDTDLTVKDLTGNVDVLFNCSKNTVEISAVTVKSPVPGDPDAMIYDENATINAFAGYKRIYQ